MPVVREITQCLNCGSAAHLNFCPNCGQETRLHVPSAREFIHEFIGHYVALEGRLWRTLRLLAFKPGMLTTEYLAGRRERYVIPLRLFLTFSILFFAVLKFGGTQSAPPEAPPQVRAETAEAARAVQEVLPARAGEEPADRKPGPSGINIDAGWFGKKVEQKLQRFNEMPSAEKSRAVTGVFFAYVPYAMFLLMPVFALYLKLLYLGSGRRYGEHLLFALHTNAFAYFQLTLLMLSPWKWLSFALLAWLVFYLPTAMRRVYGGSRTVTFVRWIVLAFLHFVSLLLAVAGTLALAIVG